MNRTIEALLAPGMGAIFKPREVRILTLMAFGTPLKQMSAELGLTSGTIKVYLSQLYQRERLHNGVHAVAIFVKQQVTRSLLYEANPPTKHIVAHLPVPINESTRPDTY